jgi:Zn-finger nucleic acid-binding protein
MPAHGNVCSYCGSRNNVDLRGIHEYTVTTPESDRDCPRCNVKMQTLNIQADGTFLIEQCRECFGLFFDPGELEALLESSVTNVFAIDYQRLDASVRGRAPETVRYERCPVCGTYMNRVNFGSRSGVVVDRCKGHGVWLDGGQLRQLLEWKKAGGQLLHQKVQAEREQEEAERERERAAERKALAQGAGDGSIWESGHGPGGPDLPHLLIGLVERLFR